MRQHLAPFCLPEQAGTETFPRLPSADRCCRPGHIISLVPPGKIQSPNFVSFHVPLTFNKLDLRDYLYHVYDVEVRAVRSWIYQPAPRQRYEPQNGPARGPWYRPRPKKMMTVELVKPFVMPQEPADLGPWDQEMYQRFQKTMDDEKIKRRGLEKNFYPLRDEQEVESRRIQLAKEAQDFVRGRKTWTNGLMLDEKWTKFKQPAQTWRKP